MTLDEFLMGLALVWVLDEELQDWDMPIDTWTELYDVSEWFQSQVFFSARNTLREFPRPEVSLRAMAKTLKMVGL
jgi:hypothetical protein